MNKFNFVQTMGFFLFIAFMLGFASGPDRGTKLADAAETDEFSTDRNPFDSGWDVETPRETVRGPSAPANLKLEGIGIGPSGSFAVINGEIYEEGEEKGGIIVSQIKKKEVDIITNGIKMTLSSKKSGS